MEQRLMAKATLSIFYSMVFACVSFRSISAADEFQVRVQKCATILSSAFKDQPDGSVDFEWTEELPPTVKLPEGYELPPNSIRFIPHMDSTTIEMPRVQVGEFRAFQEFFALGGKGKIYKETSPHGESEWFLIVDELPPFDPTSNSYLLFMRDLHLYRHLREAMGQGLPVILEDNSHVYGAVWGKDSGRQRGLLFSQRDKKWVGTKLLMISANMGDVVFIHELFHEQDPFLDDPKSMNEDRIFEFLIKNLSEIDPIKAKRQIREFIAEQRADASALKEMRRRMIANPGGTTPVRTPGTLDGVTFVSYQTALEDWKALTIKSRIGHENFYGKDVYEILKTMHFKNPKLAMKLRELIAAELLPSEDLPIDILLTPLQ